MLLSFFKTLENINGEAILYENGNAISSLPLDLRNILPGEFKVLEIPIINKRNIKSNKEYILNFIFKLNKKTKWGKKGHLIASDQFIIQTII